MNHNTSTICKLNDDFRTTLTGGTFLITVGVQALIGSDRTAALVMLTGFKNFTPDNDPHGEHDFGAFTVAGEKLFWRIDYYDKSNQFHSPDATDPAVTNRVLTLMLASEY